MSQNEKENQTPAQGLWEEEFYEEKTEEEEARQLIAFRLDKESYAIEITRIKEVTKVPPITYLPQAPDHILGVINLRGAVVSVTDPKRLFNIPATQPTALSRIIVVEHGVRDTGLLVDQIEEILKLPVSKIDPPLATLDGPAADFIEGESEVNGRLLGILKVDKIFEQQTETVA